MAMDGFRVSHKVSIKNISIKLKFFADPLGVAAPERAFTRVRYAIVATSNTAQYGLTWAAPIDEILPYRPWGYSSRLDTEIRDDSALFKWRTLRKGSFIIRHHDAFLREKSRSIYHDFKRALTYEYDWDDQNGQQVTGVKKLFLVLRSDTPVTYAQKVRVAGLVKLGYKDL